MLDLLKESNGNLVICGDGQHDSRGHCAKYGAYSVMCCNNQKLIHFELVQVQCDPSYYFVTFVDNKTENRSYFD